MINIRTNKGPTAARALAEARIGGKSVGIKTIFVVRDRDGEETDERDYVFEPGGTRVEA